jgi:SP family general alpha glucoside:H+ symporter-like MFS transporter
VVYCYFRLPEPTGRTFSEIDLLFERKVPARQFKRTQVNAFEASVSNLLAVGEKEHIRESDKA